MTNQKSLMAGVGFGLAFALIIGIIVLFSNGAAPGSGIGQLFATPTLTPTATLVPTATRSAESLCREATTTWVRGMNKFIFFLYKIRRSDPRETEIALRDAQTRINELIVPECAFAQLNEIDSSFRSWIAYHVEFNENAGQAETEKGDSSKAITDYIAFLKVNNFTAELEELRTETSAIATQVAGYPTSTPMPVLSIAEQCTQDVLMFRTNVDGYFESLKSYLDILETYAKGDTVTSADPKIIESSSTALKEFTAPTCIEEAQEILYLLLISMDTIKPAFVEIQVESASGKPNAKSFSRVRNLLNEANAFKRDLDAKYATIPQSLAVLSGDVASDGSPLDENAQDEMLDDLPLKDYALRVEDFPTGMNRSSSKMETIEEVAQQWDEPATALANFQRIGRKDTYRATFERPGNLAIDVAGADRYTISISRTASAQKTSELIAFVQTSRTEFTPEEMKLKNVDEVIAYKKEALCVDGKYQTYMCRSVSVYLRKGNIMAQINALAYTGELNMKIVTKYAQTIADRMNP